MALQELWVSKTSTEVNSRRPRPSSFSTQTPTPKNHLLFSAAAARRSTDAHNPCQASLKNSNEGLVLTAKAVLCLASPTSRLKLPGEPD